MLNRPSELFTGFHIVRPDIFPSFNSFAWEFCKPRLMPWGWDYSGASHTKKLHRLFKQYVGIRRTKAEVMPELPPKMRHIIPLDITNRDTYNKATKDFIRWLKTESPDKARKAQKAEKLTQLGYLRRLTAKGKLKAVINWIEQFTEQNPDEKLVVFGIHKKLMLKPLYRHFIDSAVLLDGDTPSKKRKRIVEPSVI
jgi:SWI/SNF-related matrix-associated actin-dependent regulator 1 of chromatin subfamily A